MNCQIRMRAKGKGAKDEAGNREPTETGGVSENEKS